MRVPFSTLRMHFPDKQNVEPEELYHWIGYRENIGNPNFENTCAIRLSLALLGAGYPNPGAWVIKAGKYKGRAIETRQRKPSSWLVHQLGQPEKFKSGLEAENKIGPRRGIVSFFNIYGDNRAQGHIAIIPKDRWGRYIRCGNEIDGTATGCYWSPKDVWFWDMR